MCRYKHIYMRWPRKPERTEKHYLNSHYSEDKLCVCLREVGLYLRRQTNQGTVGEHSNHAHRLERQLEQIARKEEREKKQFRILAQNIK